MPNYVSRALKCVLVNLWNGEAFDCLFNPQELNEKLQVNWNRLTVPGLSHQVLQYQSTSNRQLEKVEFYLDRFFAEEQPGNFDILLFRAFLRSLTVPPQGNEDITGTAPPRVLFIWPGVLTLECVVSSVEFHYKQFGKNSLLVYTATVGFEQILDKRITSEELRSEVDL